MGREGVEGKVGKRKERGKEGGQEKRKDGGEANLDRYLVIWYVI